MRLQRISGVTHVPASERKLHNGWVERKMSLVAGAGFEPGLPRRSSEGSEGGRPLGYEGNGDSNVGPLRATYSNKTAASLPLLLLSVALICYQFPHNSRKV